MVQIARAATLAACFLHQIAWRRFFAGRGLSEKSLAKWSGAFLLGYRPFLAASFKIIASRIPACASRSSTTEPAWSR